MANNNTANKSRDERKRVTWKDLYANKFAGALTFQLQCTDEDTLFVDEVVRHLPQKRLAVLGRFRGEPVFAKIFFDPRHAIRHMQMDRKGNQILQASKIPTPNIIYQGTTKEKRIYVIVFEHIVNGKNLEELWRGRESNEKIMPILKSVIVELATQHVLGVIQEDLHLKNFLLTDKTIYSVDGAQIVAFDYLLPKKQSLNNLALFLSQLGVGCESLQEELFKHYANARGWLLKPEDASLLFANIHEWNKIRWEQYQKKIFRNCTDFANYTDWRLFMMYDRKYAHPEFIQFLRNPEGLFQHPDAVPLKSGRSATVIKIKLDEREFVVKRYNIKGFWHFLRRCLRPTRAAVCWRLAQKLHLFGITTAKPIALIESRYFAFKGKAYYVTEYIDAKHAKAFFMEGNKDPVQIQNSIQQIANLLKNLAKVEVTHGDLKATNILINEKGHPYLIDLDGATEHDHRHSLRAAWRKEINRFLNNFTEQPSVLNQFQQQLIGGKEKGK